jgi:hypothetical protein
MLSLSANMQGQEVDLQMVAGEDNASGGGIRHGRELAAFAEAVASRDETDLEKSRSALVQAGGAEVMVDAAAVAANFQRMVRIADSTGIPLDKVANALSTPAQQSLNLRSFGSAANTPLPGFWQRLQGVFIRALAPRVLRRMAPK